MSAFAGFAKWSPLGYPVGCCAVEVTNDELDTYFSDNLPSCEQMTRVTICDTDGQSTHQAKQ